MAYSVDWVGKVISIPTADLDLVSGTRYSLQMSDFLGEIRRLEAAFDEGLWAPQILDHANPRLNFAGINFAGFDELINGYQVQVTGVATRVDLIGSNTNFVDRLIPTGVSVVPSNSAGYILVETGTSGLTAEESAALLQNTADLAAVRTEVENLVTGQPVKGVALPNFTFKMIDSADHASPAIGKTVTATVRRDAGSFGPADNAPSELGGGWYTIDLSAADMDGDIVSLSFSADGADDTGATIVTAKSQP